MVKKDKRGYPVRFWDRAWGEPPIRGDVVYEFSDGTQLQYTSVIPHGALYEFVNGTFTKKDEPSC